MVYKQTSLGRLIAKIYADFAVDYSDWEANLPEWVGDALGLMNIYSGYVPLQMTKTVSQYRCTLPCHLRVLRGIEYDGMRLNKTLAMNKTNPDTIDQRYHPTESYDITKNGSITTTFESGEITFYYLGIPTDCHGYPMIPDTEKVLEALAWRVMRMITLRGHKHPVVTFEMADKAWETYYPRAKNSASSLDADTRELHKELWTSMLVSPNAWRNSFFDDTAATYATAAASNLNIFTITFNVNVTGFTIIVSPDMPITVDIASSQYHTEREAGTYTYTVSKVGYTTHTGSVTVQAMNITKTITLI